MSRALTNILNPFSIFTVLYAAVAFAASSPARAAVLVGVELAAAAAVAIVVMLLAGRKRVGGFWLSGRSERLLPAVFLLGAFVALLAAMVVLSAPFELLATTISIGLTAAICAAITLRWKISAHSAVAGHAAVAGPLALGAVGLLFTLALPAVMWARVNQRAHTPGQTMTAAAIGAAMAFLFLI